MDLDFTLIIQLVLVLVALVIGAQLMAKPFLQAMLQREARIEGAKGEAAKLEQETKNLEEQFDAIITEKQHIFAAQRKSQSLQSRCAVQNRQHELQAQHNQCLEAAQKDLATYEAATKDKLANIAGELSDKLVAALLSKETK